MRVERPKARALHAVSSGVVVAVVASFAALFFKSEVTRATHVDPTQPTTIVVGPPAGIAPMARVDGRRRGRSPHPLPSRPKILWRRSTRGGLDFAPLAVDARGAILVPSATLPELLQLSPEGGNAWRASTRRGPSIAGAALLGDGTRVVATSAGELVGFAPDGALRFATGLDLLERNARLGVLPLEDGGVAIASGQEVCEVDADGTVRQKTRLAERAMGPLVTTSAGTIATSSSGAVYLMRAGYTRRVGTFGGEPSESGASTADGRTLWAVVDHQRVVALDLANGATQVRFAVNDQSLHGPVVFGHGDILVLTTWTGVLVTLEPNGTEMRRTPLEPRFSTLVTDAGKVDFAALEESPPPVTDAEGRVAFARFGGRIGVVASDGAVALVANPACNSPAALAPAGAKRMVVGCRDGTVLLIGDENP
jgi:outer membrane protein assembly factor BamB